MNGGRSEHAGVCSEMKELEDVQRFWMALKERSRILKTSEVVNLKLMEQFVWKAKK